MGEYLPLQPLLVSSLGLAATIAEPLQKIADLEGSSALDTAKEYQAAYLFLKNLEGASAVRKQIGEELERARKIFHREGAVVFEEKGPQQYVPAMIPLDAERSSPGLIRNDLKTDERENILLCAGGCLRETFGLPQVATDGKEVFVHFVNSFQTGSRLFGKVVLDERGGGHVIHLFRLFLGGGIFDGEDFFKERMALGLAMHSGKVFAVWETPTQERVYNPLAGKSVEHVQFSCR